MTCLLITTEHESDYASVDIWITNPSCGPARMTGTPNGPCEVWLLWSFVFLWDGEDPGNTSLMPTIRPRTRRGSI